MAPEYHIQVTDLPFPHKDYIEANNPIYPPQSEYLASLQPIQKAIYDQWRQNQWTDNDCYRYFTCVERSMGFESAWLRHRGYDEQKIQDWNEACQEIYIVPELKKEDAKGHLLQMASAAQESTIRRGRLWEKIEAGEQLD
ncbi:hypothetical protein N7454_006320 [Penicillium verhagenii]|nr:hypothetical protein N7454_006320 [Penicillium verhagenii]